MYYVKVLTIFVLLLFSNSTKDYNLSYKNTKFQMRYYIAELIEKYEGRLYRPYMCPASYNSIGVGHVLLAKDNCLTFPVTDKQIDSILMSDIEITKQEALKIHPQLKDSFVIYTAAWLIFMYGNKYRKMSLKFKIDKNEEIENELIKYSYYKRKSDSTYIFSTNIYNSLKNINSIYARRSKIK